MQWPIIEKIKKLLKIIVYFFLYDCLLFARNKSSDLGSYSIDIVVSLKM